VPPINPVVALVGYFGYGTFGINLEAGSDAAELSWRTQNAFLGQFTSTAEMGAQLYMWSQKDSFLTQYGPELETISDLVMKAEIAIDVMVEQMDRYGAQFEAIAGQFEARLDDVDTLRRDHPDWAADHADALAAKASRDRQALDDLRSVLAGMPEIRAELVRLVEWIRQLHRGSDGQGTGLGWQVNAEVLTRLGSTYVELNDVLSRLLLIAPPDSEPPPTNARPPVRDFDEWRSGLPEPPEMYAEPTPEERAEAERRAAELDRLGSRAWPGGPAEGGGDGRGAPR
jgi:hypothetical protein